MRVVLFLTFMCYLTLGYGAVNHDVRILIEVSGRMMQVICCIAAVELLIILLTDGVVDVSAKSFMQSAESRERILTELSSALQKNNIKVYSIALSTQANRELLRQLTKKN